MRFDYQILLKSPHFTILAGYALSTMCAVFNFYDCVF